MDSTFSFVAEEVLFEYPDGSESKKVCAYDENGNQTLEAYFDWDSEAKDWVVSSKEESTYEYNGGLFKEVWRSYSRESETLESWIESRHRLAE